MRKRLAAMLSSLAITSCSVVGIRDTAEPRYIVLQKLTPTIEVREYGPRIVAETVVNSSEIQARFTGFQRLAGYIFGGNTTQRKIAMTAPVTQSAAKGETIPMTAPVAQNRAGSDGWRIQFFMPAGATLATLPRPNDPSVTLRELPSEIYAVLRFSGDRGPAAIREKEPELAKAVGGSPWHITGPTTAWFYDPPWTIPFFRRNELAVPVARNQPVSR